MKRMIMFAAIVGGVVAYRSSRRITRRRVTAAISRRMLQHMERIMAGLPESSPPKLVTSVLPRIREQNDHIVAMLEEQNALLRDHLRSAHGAAVPEF